MTAQTTLASCAARGIYSKGYGLSRPRLPQSSIGKGATYGNVQDAFKYNRARKNVIIGGAIILVCLTALSCVSSYMIYRGGFSDLPLIFQQALALFAVVVVEGAFVWLVYGFTRAFSSGMERLISLAGIGFLVVVMLINLVTHFMMVKKVELHPFQIEWIDWGAVTVFVAVLLIVLFITLADPVIRVRSATRLDRWKTTKIIKPHYRTDTIKRKRPTRPFSGRIGLREARGA